MSTASTFRFHYAADPHTLAGRPPQLAAQVLAGALLDAFRAIDPTSRVACDVRCDAGGVVLEGHVSRVGVTEVACVDSVGCLPAALDYVI